ncbi:MAG: IS3 family transposase [Candidatus Thiodiazotropha sp. 6PLUC6]
MKKGQRLSLVEHRHPDVSITSQCRLLGVSRSSVYYQSRKDLTEDLTLMRMIDEQYLKTPFYGSRRMCTFLRGQGYNINRKRVRRLMRQMGLEAIYPKPRTSQPGEGHKIYPYLLKGRSPRSPGDL